MTNKKYKPEIMIYHDKDSDEYVISGLKLEDLINLYLIATIENNQTVEQQIKNNPVSIVTIVFDYIKNHDYKNVLENIDLFKWEAYHQLKEVLNSIGTEVDQNDTVNTTKINVADRPDELPIRPKTTNDPGKWLHTVQPAITTAIHNNSNEFDELIKKMYDILLKNTNKPIVVQNDEKQDDISTTFGSVKLIKNTKKRIKNDIFSKRS